MIDKLNYCSKLFKNKSITYSNNTININMDMEPYEVSELINDNYLEIESLLSKMNLKINSYRLYEEEYGGFCHYGVLQFDIDKLNLKELDLIKTLLFN